MATRKKLIQLSKTANILTSYNYVLFVQSASDKKALKLNLKDVSDIRLFKCKNNTVQKALSQYFPCFSNNDEYALFSNVFQGPNCIVAGNDLQQLPHVWKSLTAIPHLFFCGAIIEQTFTDHLELEQAISSVYNVPKEVVYHRFLSTLNTVDNLTSILNTKTYSLLSTLSNISEK